MKSRLAISLVTGALALAAAADYQRWLLGPSGADGDSSPFSARIAIVATSSGASQQTVLDDDVMAGFGLDENIVAPYWPKLKMGSFGGDSERRVANIIYRELVSASSMPARRGASGADDGDFAYFSSDIADICVAGSVKNPYNATTNVWERNPCTIPEPTSAALALFGIALALLRRQR